MIRFKKRIKVRRGVKSIFPTQGWNKYKDDIIRHLLIIGTIIILTVIMCWGGI